MDEQNTNKSYEKLYEELFERTEDLHESNKRRIKRGLFGFIVLPVVLLIIRVVTDSDKILFLIIWVIAMFILCAYLMTVEYLDDAIQKTLKDVTDQEAEFDKLLGTPENIPGRIYDRMTEFKLPRLTTSFSRSAVNKQDDSSETQEKGDAE